MVIQNNGLYYAGYGIARSLIGLGRELGDLHPEVVGGKEGSVKLYAAIVRTKPYRLVVLEDRDEVVIADLVDILVGALNGSYSPYRDHPKPIISVVENGHRGLVSMLKKTHSGEGELRFFVSRKVGDEIDVGLSCVGVG